MSRHRLNVFITLIFVLLIIAGITAWLTGPVTNDSNEPEETAAPAPTSSVETPPPAVNTDKPVESAAPSQTPQASDEPEESQEPEDPSIPKTRTLNLSGDFNTTTGTNLNMSVKWTAVSKNDETVTLTATAYIYSYTMHYGSTTGTMSINGISKSFVSNSINYDNTDKLQEVKLCTMSVDLPIAVGESVSIPVSATWDFNGTYNKQEFSGISADQYILIEG